MPCRLLMVSAFQFETFIYDTDQISVFRGGSYLARELPGWISELPQVGTLLSPISVGGSIGLFEVVGQTDQEQNLVNEIQHALAGHAEYRYVPTTVVEATAADFRSALIAVRARTAHAQAVGAPLRVESEPSDTKISDGRSSVCEWTGARAVHFSDGTSDSAMSEFTHKRFRLGSRLRSQASLLAGAAQGSFLSTDLAVRDALADARGPMSFEDIANASEKLNNKLAYLYFDGNAFGASRASSEGAKETLAEFDAELRESRAEALASLLTAGFRAGADEPLNRLVTHAPDPKDTQVNLEPLLWGGDESLLVMPASCGFAALWHMQEALAASALGSKGLTHAFGLLFCGLHTPVKEARAMTEKLADLGKAVTRTKPRDSWSVAYMHSADFVPFSDMKQYWGTRCGRDVSTPDILTGLHFPVDTSPVADALDTLTQLPRRQTRRLGHAFLRQAPAEELSPLANYCRARDRLFELLSTNQRQAVSDAVSELCTGWFGPGVKTTNPTLCHPAEPWLWVLIEDAFDALNEPGKTDSEAAA